jgi:hypothetical protein
VLCPTLIHLYPLHRVLAPILGTTHHLHRVSLASLARSLLDEAPSLATTLPPTMGTRVQHPRPADLRKAGPRSPPRPLSFAPPL